MKVKDMYAKLRQIDNYIDEISGLIITTRSSDTASVTVGSGFLQATRKFLSEYKNILEDMEIEEEK